jgi:erythronate-4-phosphate dehydrogenase
MRTVCAASVLFGREAFATLGEVVVLPDRKIGREDLRGADALVVRSKTKVDRTLLDGTGVRYVGTATAGFDHLDTAALESAGVHWFAAAGCNATSVAEWFVSALLALGERHGLDGEGRTLAVVGIGQVGRRVVARAAALGLRVLQNDPPRRAAEGDAAPELLDLDAILPQADVVTLHVPLADGGRWPTRRLAGARFFERLRPGAVFVNASRGEVVDEGALLGALRDGRVRHAVLDVWENEPEIDNGLLARADLGTPHIAGYSFDGKLRGTEMVYADLCRFAGRPPVWDAGALAPAPARPRIELDARGLGVPAALWEAVRQIYDIRDDDRALRGGPAGDAAALGERFERLRKEYPVRREFATAAVRVSGGDPSLPRRLAALGFAAG